MTSKDRNIGIAVGVFCFSIIAIPFLSIFSIGGAIAGWSPYDDLAATGCILLFAGISTGLGWSVARRSKRLIFIFVSAYLTVILIPIILAIAALD